ncbi:Hydrolase, alpha/beta fold family protein [Sulfitobacter noctilucae]|uniref:alpha/beta fold hydrolase n=1 Tax=Sulfitobacter noctilucae TaxID=1342302 RepID=UPI000468BBCA|nr:alpha/beta fold hydrolase [Sulfitobacter noctilucae]KIN70816.1 Hydrolase, alpha/beta fold family protein [Sulfitobacter noctilucae]
MLSYSEHGEARPGTPDLIIAHGLFGSGRNWGVIAKRLSDSRRVITPDMRNHGTSPRETSHSYADMAADLAELIIETGSPADLCGHSMGGKAAMALALTQPHLIRKLIVADIAPTAYTHSQQPMIDAMRTVDLAGLTRRSDALDQLGAAGVEPALQSFFTQSLDVPNKSWRLNLDALEDQMPQIMGWPKDLTGPFDGPTLFLSGGNSDYVRAEHRPLIKSLFPKARFAKIPDTGHWLHAENPRAFEATLRAYLDA